MKIVRYSSDRAEEWDEFIKGSKNGTFLFLRGYMDYHSDRFVDHSLMYYSDKDKVLAVMAANEKDKVLYSHNGLTYGGLVLDPKVHIRDVGHMINITLKYLKENGFIEWYYKQVPVIYHTIPSDEDIYWLWRYNSTVTNCNMMTAIDLHSNMSILSSRKKTYWNKLLRQGYTVEKNTHIQEFWPILEDNLKERFDAKPVHSLTEIELLQSKFPNNIICCTVKNPDGKVVAGTLLFITVKVVRTQYISASHEGRHTNALDFLMLTLIEHYKKSTQYKYFEFGTSMAEDGIQLNDGLILQKESFGGRAIACKTFRITI